MSRRPCGTNRAPGPCLIKIEGGRACPDLALFDGAGEGNRTLMTSLEDRWHGQALSCEDGGPGHWLASARELP
jgi:hypothetical protein